MESPPLSAPPPRPEAASVAVIIAAWRASAFIGKAVASALAQPEASEVIVVDDASGDGGVTLAAARAADDGSGRLSLIGLERNGGPARARNAAIAASRAPWLSILDADDYFEPGRLARVLAQSTDREMIADDLFQVEAGAPISSGRAMWFEDEGRVTDVSLAAFVQGNLTRASRYRRELGFLKPLMSRAFLDRHNLRYDETMRLGEDFDLYARALAAGARLRLIPASGYVSIMRSDSLSAQHSRSELAAAEAADQRLLELKGLSSAERRALLAHELLISKKIAWIDFVEALKARRLLTAAVVVLRDPRRAPHVVSVLAKTVSRKLSGRPAGVGT